MSKFTKGKWKIDMSSSVSYECLHDFIYPEDLQVRQIDEDVHIALVNHAYPEWQANARLIAAAPEMYEAITECADTLEALKNRDDSKEAAEFYEVEELIHYLWELLTYIDGEEAANE